MSNNGYFYAGSHLVFNSGFVKNREKGIRLDLSWDMNRKSPISRSPDGSNAKLDKLLGSLKKSLGGYNIKKQNGKKIKKKIIM